MRTNKPRAAHRGATMVELAVVVVVLAILSVVSVAGYQAAVGGAQDESATITVVAVMKEAQTLAVQDGRTVFTEADVTTAIGDLPDGLAFGVTAQSSRPWVPEPGATSCELGVAEFVISSSGTGNCITAPAGTIAEDPRPATYALSADASEAVVSVRSETGLAVFARARVTGPVTTGHDATAVFPTTVPDPSAVIGVVTPNPTGTGTSRAYDTAVGADGTIYATGYFTGTVEFGSVTLTATDLQDGFVIAIDPDTNEVIWAEAAGTDGNSRGRSLAVTSDAVYVSGHYNSSVAPGGILAGLPANGIPADINATDGFLVRLDLAGNVEWAVTGGTDSTTRRSYAESVAADGTGVVLSGSYGVGTPTGFLSALASVPGGGTHTDMYTVSLDPVDGSVLWSVRGGDPDIGDSDYAHGNDMDATHVYVVGNYKGTPTGALAGVPTTGSAFQSYVVKLDRAAGTQVWVVAGGGAATEHDSTEGVSISPAGLFVAGSFNGAAQLGFVAGLDPAAAGGGLAGKDAYIASLDPATGAPIWVERLGAPGEDDAFDVAERAGVLYVSGLMSGEEPTGVASPLGESSAARTSYVIAVSAADGAWEWGARGSSDSTVGGYEMAPGVATTDGAVVAAGGYGMSTTANLGFLGDAATSTGAESFYVVRIGV